MRADVPHAELPASEDERLPSESLHLAAEMLAGFRGVVANMWSIEDKCLPGAEVDVYGGLLEVLRLLWVLRWGS